MNRIITTLGSVAIVAGIGVAVPAIASGDGSVDVPCSVPTIVVTDAPATTEVIEGLPEIWANFSPNHNQGPFDGPPSYPTDERGEWHIHYQIPGGHKGEDGVYQQDNPGNGNADWFYRQNGTDAQVIEHPAVTHTEANPDYPCNSTEPTGTTEPTDGGTNSESPSTDTEIPFPANPTVFDPCGADNAVWVVRAVGGVISWEVSEANGHLVASITEDGKVFPNGERTVDYGVAPETNVSVCDAPSTPTDEPSNNTDKPGKKRQRTSEALPATGV